MVTTIELRLDLFLPFNHNQDKQYFPDNFMTYQPILISTDLNKQVIDFEILDGN